MRIIVLVKQILDPSGITIRRDKERMFINREEYVIGPPSSAAVEAGLRIKDAQPDGTQVIALSLGPSRVDDALRETLAMGCDAAYHISDTVFQEADPSATARILAAAVQRLAGADLIIAGVASGDRGSGQLGPRLAELLSYRQVTAAFALEAGDGQLLATRRWRNGFARVACPLPVVVTVEPEAFPARYPHGARIINAYREWQVTTWNAVDLGLEGIDFAPLVAVRSESYPPPLESGEQYRGEPAAVAKDVLQALHLQRLIEGAEHGL
jgi:electron transfer flavoprotein beta subunit